MYAGTPTAAFNVPGGRFAPTPIPNPDVVQRHPISMVLDDVPHFGVALPERLRPSEPIVGFNATQFFMLDDGKTGVMALGSFTGTEIVEMLRVFLDGLQSLVNRGATQLIIDVVSFALNHGS